MRRGPHTRARDARRDYSPDPMPPELPSCSSPPPVSSPPSSIPSALGSAISSNSSRMSPAPFDDARRTESHVYRRAPQHQWRPPSYRPLCRSIAQPPGGVKELSVTRLILEVSG